jgi:FMN reductase
MTARTLAVVTAGLSQPSSTRLLADQLTAATQQELLERGIPVEVTVVEVREHAHDVVNHALTGFPPAALTPAIEAVTSADGLIAVTPTFNASYSGLFKSFFDVLPEGALVDQPVLIGATGGTARHSLALEHALRPMFTYLRAVVMPTAVFAAPEDWAGATAGGALRRRIARAAGELAEQVQRRERKPAEDPFTLTTSFEDLLP